MSILLLHLTLPQHFISYISMILNYLQQEHNTLKWVIYHLVT